MNNIIKNDLKKGSESEKLCIDVICKFLKCEMKKTDYSYNEFDYICSNSQIVAELKSRNCTCEKYDSTMIGYNKILKGYNLINDGYKVYLFFHFENGLYYFKLTKKNINLSWIREGGRYDRGCVEKSQYCFIPTRLLKKC